MNYSNTIIYKIVCKDIDIKECYVGQTTNFSKRKAGHKINCNDLNSKDYNCYVYQFIRENGGWDNWSMIEVEKYNATDKLDAGKKERYWIETLEAKLNKQIPGQTFNEWYVKNKDKLKIKHKKYNEENKEYFKEIKKIYADEHKEEAKEYQKIYREQNKVEIADYKKNWYEQNREQIILKNREKYNQTKDKINAQRRLNRALKKEAQA